MDYEVGMWVRDTAATQGNQAYYRVSRAPNATRNGAVNIYISHITEHSMNVGHAAGGGWELTVHDVPIVDQHMIDWLNLQYVTHKLRKAAT